MTRNEIMQADTCGQGCGGMFLVIPSVVIKDDALSMSAKMLYGIITWRCGENARCWLSNKALGETLHLSVKRISALLSDLEKQGHIETEIIRDERNQIVRRYIYPIVKSSRAECQREDMENNTPMLENEHTPPQNRAYPMLKNEEEIYKEEIKNNIHPNPKGDSGDNLNEILEQLKQMTVSDDSRVASAAVVEMLKSRGFKCRTQVSVPSRDEDGEYGGRIGIVAAKGNFTAAIEMDRRSPREKSIYKLREYDCSARIICIRGGEYGTKIAGIDAVVSLKSERMHWKQERFEGFWKFYPRGEDKQAAIRAWDKLKPSDELIAQIGGALIRQKQSDNWQRGIGIPYAATYLNQRRWEDEISEAAPDKGGGWADDPEVI